MSTIWVVSFYAVALALALFLLLRYKAQSWYWHVLSAAAALGLGLVPPPAGWQGPKWDLAFGCTFVFLLVWGIGGIVSYRTHAVRHKQA